MKSVSPAHFNTLLDNQMLVASRQDPEQITHYDENGTSYRVRKDGDDYFGHRIKGEGEPTITLTKSDTTFYKFRFDSFCKLIKNSNSFTGRYMAPTQRIHFIGKTQVGSNSICSCVGLFDSDNRAKQELFALSSNYPQHKSFIILSPSFEVNEELSGRLYDKGIYYRTLDFGCDDKWKIDLSVIKTDKEQKSTFDIPPINATEKKKYAKDYPRKDVIEFVNRTTGARSGIVSINGRGLELQYNLYGLLLALAKALKQDVDSGWVHCDTLENEKIVRNRNHFHRSMSELSRKLDPFAEDDNKIKLLQNLTRKSKYRLSTMPSRIKLPHSRWLASKYTTIKNEIIKERAKRVGEANM
ncbi:MAG: hypothetical protein KDD45_07535 [Bdellovibrionales bacterium]|nr:hypothetical protein [Bdellovibrionales bacterium]